MHKLKTARFTPVNRQWARTAILALGAALLIASCRTATTEEPGYARVLSAMAPKGELARVRIGMSYAELLQIRASMRPLGYVGAYETIAGDTIRYWFEPAPREPDFDDASADLIKEDAKLVGVEKWTISNSTAESEQAWLRDVTKLFGKSAERECFKYQRGSMHSVAIARMEKLWSG